MGYGFVWVGFGWRLGCAADLVALEICLGWVSWRFSLIGLEIPFAVYVVFSRVGDLVGLGICLDWNFGLVNMEIKLE